VSLSVLPPAVLEWLKSRGAALLQAGRSERQPAFEPGRVYDGRIAQGLPNGRHVVQVADRSLNMALPGEARPGDTVKLLYLKSDPRPTFLLVPDRAAQGADRSVRVSDAAMKVAALARWAAADAARMPPRPAAPAQPDPAAGAGRLAALPALPDVAPPGPAATRPAAAPLLEQPSAQGRDWLAPLRRAVKESGLFYESHLNRWVRGDQSLAEIRREPQARLAQPDWAGQARVADLDGMPEEAARLAGRQLQLLEGQPFVWQGPAWPGQSMQWQVEERPEHGAGEDEPAPWRTQLRLTLPRLGGVTAEIALLSRGLQLRLHADTAQAGAAMTAALPDLAGRLEAAGLAVLGLAVEAGPETQTPAPAAMGATDADGGRGR